MKLNRDQSDLVIVMEHVRNGRLPLALHTNDDVLGHAEDDKHHQYLDHNWPAGIPDKPTMNIKIDDGIPIPDIAKGRRSEGAEEIIKTLKAMKPGQSFAIECENKAETVRLGSQLHNIAKRMDTKPIITIRNLKPKEAGGKWTVRTWLLELENPPTEQEAK